MNRNINHLHERSIKIVFRKSTSSFHELPQKDHPFTIHHRNIQRFGIELYKVKENLFNDIMNYTFSPRTLKYNLRAKAKFFKNSVNISKYDLNSLKLASAIFYQIFISHQMIAPQRLWKMFFISSKKLSSFSRYSNFISIFPSFSPCQPLL